MPLADGVRRPRGSKAQRPRGAVGEPGPSSPGPARVGRLEAAAPRPSRSRNEPTRRRRLPRRGLRPCPRAPLAADRPIRRLFPGLAGSPRRPRRSSQPEALLSARGASANPAYSPAYPPGGGGRPARAPAWQSRRCRAALEGRRKRFACGWLLRRPAAGVLHVLGPGSPAAPTAVEGELLEATAEGRDGWME